MQLDFCRSEFWGEVWSSSSEERRKHQGEALFVAERLPGGEIGRHLLPHEVLVSPGQGEVLPVVPVAHASR